MHNYVTWDSLNYSKPNMTNYWTSCWYLCTYSQNCSYGYGGLVEGVLVIEHISLSPQPRWASSMESLGLIWTEFWVWTWLKYANL